MPVNGVSISNKFSFGIFYMLILISFIFKLPPLVILGSMISLMVVHVFLFPDDFLLFPFIVYPFRFVIRVPDIDTVFLSLLPEAITIISLIAFLIKIRIPKSLEVVSKTKFYLTIFTVFSTLIILLHGIFYESMYFLVVLRTYVLPLIFTLAVVHCAGRKKDIPYNALTFYMISTSIIAIISLSQYFNLYKLPSNELIFYRTHVAGGYDDRALYESERSVGSFILPRLNLLSGGSLGSSAGFFFAVGILWQTTIFRKRKFLRVILSGVCILSALLTLSFSILNTFLILILIYLFVGKVNKRSIFSSTIFRMLLALLFVPVLFYLRIGEKTLIEYVIGTYMESPATMLPISTIFFGFGIDYFSAKYSIVPDNNIGDIGILKIFFQAGIFSLCLLLLSFYYLIAESVKKIRLGNTQIKYTFLFIVLLILILIHQNWMFGSPFYLLFSASVAGILSADVQSKTDNVPVNKLLE